MPETGKGKLASGAQRVPAQGRQGAEREHARPFGGGQEAVPVLVSEAHPGQAFTGLLADEHGSRPTGSPI